jgi:hypothetical protein
MKENNDTPFDRATAAGETSSSASTGHSDRGPTPIFVSYIYDFVETDQGLGGDGGGRPGTLGGPIGQQTPKYKVFTYPFIPAANLAPDI